MNTRMPETATHMCIQSRKVERRRHIGMSFCFTFGKVTLSTMTECRALGASFGALDVSPPGWYLYLKVLVSSSWCHGIPSSACLTWTSEVAEVCLFPIRQGCGSQLDGSCVIQCLCIVGKEVGW